MNPSGPSPIVDFALRLLEAEDLNTLLEYSVRTLVEQFGALRAAVLDESTGEEWLHHGELAEEVGNTRWRFRLSSKKRGEYFLVLWIPHREDPSLWRQQYTDLVALIRKAFRNIDEHSNQIEAAERDELTDLETRRSAKRFLENHLGEINPLEEDLSLMMIDLDHFKLANDTLGHQAGDMVLVAAADSLRSQLRDDDRMARWGGDEFLVVLRGVNKELGLRIGERIRATFCADPRSHMVTMSIGIACLKELDSLAPVDCPSKLERLIAIADERLYESKRGGRNLVVA